MVVQKVGLFADVHYHLRKYREFEDNRFGLLCDWIQKQNYDVVFFVGDLLDKARPTLDEQGRLGNHLSKITARKIVIDGNHEAKDKNTSTYDYITIPDLEYMSKGIIDIFGVSVTVMGWTKLKHSNSIPRGDLLLSHFRSDLGFIKEEVDVKSIAAKFNNVVVGDIHSRHQPFDNVKYISSPYAVKFHKNDSADYGCMDMLIEEGSYTLEYVDLDLPTKIAFDCEPTDVESIVKKYPDDLIRLSVTGTIEQLETLKVYPNVIYNKVLEQKDVDSIDVKDELHVVEKLADMIDGRSDFTFNILDKIYKEII